ncbi:MAG: FAD-dependent oxidoreductase [Deltaproteobacteria bacterium]|nr:FAD-dependent oxidoreductase [Deltaproteobacteria bacterium]
MVLGAGCAGLAAARAALDQGWPVVLLEQAARPGGLAGGVRFGPNIYEYGPHMLHASDPEILAELRALAGPELHAYRRTIKIKFAGSWFDFPLTLGDILGKLPPATLARAGLSWAWRRLRARRLGRAAPATSATVLTQAYGRVLYEVFFRDYIARVWGLGPEEFSPAFARERVLRLRIMGRAGSSPTPAFFSTSQGFALLTDRLAEQVQARGGGLRLGARVTGLAHQAGRVRAVIYQQAGRQVTLPCAGVINTLPLPAALAMLTPPPPPPVQEAAARLHFRPAVFVGLLVRRERVLPASYVYFREHSCNRVCDLGQFGVRVEPPGHTILVAEITCAQEGRPWQDPDFAVKGVLADLEAEGLVTPDEVAERHVYRAAQAYPIYTLGFEEHRARCLEHLAGLANLRSAGRQGRFAYLNAHQALRQGREAAQSLGRPEGRPSEEYL